jgi:hypothetical protein
VRKYHQLVVFWHTECIAALGITVPAIAENDEDYDYEGD